MSIWDNFLRAKEDILNLPTPTPTNIIGDSFAVVKDLARATASTAATTYAGAFATANSAQTSNAAPPSTAAANATLGGVPNNLAGADAREILKVPEYSTLPTVLDKYIYQPTYQAAGAAALAMNSDTYHEGDPIADSLKGAWNSRKDISFGQAISDLVAQAANQLPDWGKMAKLNNVDINIYDKQMRDRVYARTYDDSGHRIDASGQRIATSSWIEDAWRNMSGGIDFGKQLVLDPLVIAGKGVKAARLANLDVARSGAVVEDVAAWSAQQSKLASDTLAVNKAKYRLIVEEPELVRAQGALDEMNTGFPHVDSVVAELNSVREASGLPPVSPSITRDEAVNQYTKYVQSLERTRATHQAVIDNFNALDVPKPQLAEGVSDFVNQVVSRQMTWNEIAQHHTLRNFAVDTEFLAKALATAAPKGEGAVTDVLLLAQMSDPSAFLRLESQQKSLLGIIDDAQTRMDDVEVQIQRALAGSTTDAVLAKRLMDQKTKLSEYVQTLKADDEYLSLLLRTDNSIVGSMPTMPFSAGRLSPIIEKWRADRAIVKAGLEDGSIKPLSRVRPDQQFDWNRVQRGPLHRAVYTAQWMGHKLGLEKPSGLVTKDGLDYFDGVKELRTYLEDTPAFDGLVSVKNDLMNRYVSATNVLERDAVLDDVEKQLVETTAKKYGIENTMTIDDKGNEVRLVDAIYEQFVKERARAVDRARREQVFAVDTNGTLITNPVITSQLAYSRPMLPAEELDRFFLDHAPNVSSARILANEMRKAKDEWVMPVWASADRLWRADVLIRLGYPQRNVLSELMVLAQYDRGLGNMFSVGEATDSMKRFASNRWSHFQDIQSRFQAGMDMLGATGTRNPLKAVRVNWADYEQFVGDHLTMLRAERKAIIDEADYFLSDPDATFLQYPHDTIARLDAQIAAEETKLTHIGQRVAAKGVRFGEQKIRGKQTVLIGPHEFAGVFEGSQGAAAHGLISSGGRTAFDSSPYHSALKEMGLQGTGTYKDIHPTDDAYFTTLAKIINQEWRGSKVAMMLISGKSQDEILSYLSTRAGQEELAKLKWTEDVLPSKSKATKRRKAGWPPDAKLDIAEKERKIIKAMDLFGMSREENYIDFVHFQIINRYLPNDAMKQLVRERLNTDQLGRGTGTVTSADLRVAAKDAELNPIHGEIMESTSIWRNPALNQAQKMSELLNGRMIKRLYTWLGQYPEDAFISHPFADAVYRGKLEEIVNVWKANGISPTNADVLQAQTMARKWAVRQSREYLYRVVRKNGIGSAIPWLAPFFQAQYSTFRRVGKLAYRNPDKSARIVYLWNQINHNSVTDQDGQKWLIWRVPQSWYDDKGLSSAVPEALRGALSAQNEFRWRAEAFNLLAAGLRLPTPDILPGENESTIQKMSRWATAAQSVVGTGPFVQIPSNLILNNHPALDKEASDALGVPIPAREILEVFASPYPSDKWYDPLLSAWNKRVISLVNGQDNNDFERTQLVMFQNHLDRIRTGEDQPLAKDALKNNELLWTQAGKEASAMLALRLAANLGAGFVPTYEGPLTKYVELYRQYQTKFGVKAYDNFLADYPDLGYVAVSRSKNLAGASQSTDAVYLRKKWNTQIEKAIADTGLPREDALPFIQMVVNGNVGDEVLRDPRASYWQRKAGDRVVLSAEQGYSNEQVREGWAQYMQEKDMYNAELNRRGISRYSNAASDLNVMFKRRWEEIGKKNPEWYQEKTTLSGANATVGFVRAMKVMLNDEKFMKTVSEDSYWWDIKGILDERDMLVNAARSSGLSSPNQAMLEMYANRIKPYLQNKSAEYYYNKFLDNDNFVLDQPR